MSFVVEKKQAFNVSYIIGCRLSGFTIESGANCPGRQIYRVPIVRFCKKTPGSDCPDAVCPDTDSNMFNSRIVLNYFLSSCNINGLIVAIKMSHKKNVNKKYSFKKDKFN